MAANKRCEDIFTLLLLKKIHVVVHEVVTVKEVRRRQDDSVRRRRQNRDKLDQEPLHQRRRFLRLSLDKEQLVRLEVRPRVQGPRGGAKAPSGREKLVRVVEQ